MLRQCWCIQFWLTRCVLVKSLQEFDPQTRWQHFGQGDHTRFLPQKVLICQFWASRLNVERPYVKGVSDRLDCYRSRMGCRDPSAKNWTDFKKGPSSIQNSYFWLCLIHFRKRLFTGFHLYLQKVLARPLWPTQTHSRALHCQVVSPSFKRPVPVCPWLSPLSRICLKAKEWRQQQRWQCCPSLPITWQFIS